jgi:hypothetical protein
MPTTTYNDHTALGAAPADTDRIPVWDTSAGAPAYVTPVELLSGHLPGDVDTNNKFIYRATKGWQVKSDNPYADIGPYHASTSYNTGLKFSMYDVKFYSNGTMWGGYDQSGFYIGTEKIRLLATTTGILEQRNGANAQEYQLCGTWTSASIYERLALRTAAGDYTIAAEAAGGGTQRNLVFDGANRQSKINDVSGTPAGTDSAIIADLQTAVAALIDATEAWGLSATS